jgi:hypothetical protein
VAKKQKGNQLHTEGAKEQGDLALKQLLHAWHQWLTPVVLAIQEAEISRIMVKSQPSQIVLKTLSQKYPTQKRAGRVASM